MLLIKEAIVAYEKASDYDAIFLEFLDKLVYKDNNLAKWYYENLKVFLS